MNVPIDITGVTLTTERLILRPWQINDLDDFYEYAKVDGVGQMAGWKPHESREESLKILNHFIEAKRTFAIVYNGKAIGSVGIEEFKQAYDGRFDDKKYRELGYVLSKDYWGQGIMPEAASAVIRYVFEEVGLDVLFCGHFTRNRQSARVQEKCGFRFLSVSKYETRLGSIEDCVLNYMTKEDYFSHRK